MRGFLDRAKKLEIKMEPAEKTLAELIDLAQDVSRDRECFDNALLRTDLHDRILQRIHERIEIEMAAIK